MALKGQRDLGFSLSSRGKMEQEIGFLGMVGMKNEVRPEAAEAFVNKSLKSDYPGPAPKFMPDSWICHCDFRTPQKAKPL